MSQSDLRAKYGPNAYDVGRRMQGPNFDQRVSERDALDPHFTRAWVDFAINGMYGRKALDIRTRLLVLTGQYTMAKSHAMLEDTIRAAVEAKVDPREVLEIVLQCIVYGGHTTVEPAIKVFHRVATDLNQRCRSTAPTASVTNRMSATTAGTPTTAPIRAPKTWSNATAGSPSAAGSCCGPSTT